MNHKIHLFTISNNKITEERVVETSRNQNLFKISLKSLNWVKINKNRIKIKLN